MYKIILLGFILMSNYAKANFGSEGVGGGDIISSEQVGSDAIDKMLNPARAQLLLYLNAIDLSTEHYPVPAPYRNLLSSDHNIINEVLKNEIFPNKLEPCLDSVGNQVDGSIYPAGHVGVCISSFNLGKKLSIDNARIQLVGLLAHEYSHLAGADETQAVEIQRDVLKGLLSTTFYETDDLIKKFSNKIFYVYFLLKELKNGMNLTSDAPLCFRAMQLTGEIGNLDDIASSTSGKLFSIINLEMRKYLSPLYFEALNIELGTCTNIARDPEYVYLKYNQAFESSSIITLSQFKEFLKKQTAYGYPYYSVDGNFEIVSIKQKQDLNQELDRFIKNFQYFESSSVGRILFIESEK
ncbi:MAG: hypothetical protein ACXVLQ_06370 [Bacteriovorax sp.]